MSKDGSTDELTPETILRAMERAKEIDARPRRNVRVVSPRVYAFAQRNPTHEGCGGKWDPLEFALVCLKCGEVCSPAAL